MANLKESFARGLTTLNVKTNNFMEESKYNTYIKTLENEIRELKSQVGEKLYTQWAQGSDMMAGIEEILVAIKNKYAEIEVQKQKIIQLQEEEKQILGNSSNAQSGREVSQTVPQTVPQPADTAAGVFCSQCGTRNLAAYKFCCKCGKPLAQ